MHSRTVSLLLNTELLQQKLEQHFCRIDNEKREPTMFPIPQAPHLYNVNDGFAAEDYKWLATMETERFEGSLNRGILYRPEIVHELVTEVESVFNERLAYGVMVLGPEGIGKSHSLINLVRKLRYDSNGKYLVTFIPDCEKFEDIHDLYEYICYSFDTCTEELQFQTPSPSPHSYYFESFVEDIDKFLLKNNKQWVLIFNNINQVFARPRFQAAKDLGYLEFPFTAITSVKKTGRITSVVSASADNKRFYMRREDGFKKYEHCLTMNRDEISVAFKVGKNDEQTKQLKMIMKVTNGVPLQAEKLVKLGFDVEAYGNQGLELIRESLIKLRQETESKWFQRITKSVVACVLAWPTDETVFCDQKNTVYLQGTARRYAPVYPLILDAYRDFFWSDIMKRVNLIELINACKGTVEPNDRLCEGIMINRCINNTVGGRPTLTCGEQRFEMPVCNIVERFGSLKLPTTLLENGIYVPLHLDFPAIDFVWKQDRTVWCVQVHVAAHDDVLPKFTSMCLKAKWQLQFKEIYLLYLSPKQSVANLDLRALPQSPIPFEIDGMNIKVIKATYDDLKWNLKIPDHDDSDSDEDDIYD
jgi:hypothetical protein